MRFCIYNNIYPNPKYCQGYNKMSVNEIKDFFFENYDKTIVFSKESSYFSLKSFRKKNIYCCSQQINTKKYLILIKLKKTINQLQERKTQN